MIIFAQHLRALFDIIGKDCTSRGVFTKEQLPDAIHKLHQAVHEEKKALHDFEKDPYDDEADEVSSAPGAAHGPGPVARHHEQHVRALAPAVRLSQRAYPLIHLMELTLAEDGCIIWEADGEF
jgi:hypothetical protein